MAIISPLHATHPSPVTHFDVYDAFRGIIPLAATFSDHQKGASAGVENQRGMRKFAREWTRINANGGKDWARMPRGRRAARPDQPACEYANEFVLFTFRLILPACAGARHISDSRTKTRDCDYAPDTRNSGMSDLIPHAALIGGC